jgi:uncharacterized protein (TIGR00251 family)
MIHIAVHVIPRASKPGIAGTRDGALLVRLQSPPVEGAANSELIQVIADAFGVPKRDVSIVAGERARLKRVAIATITQDEYDAVLRDLGVRA